MSTHEKKTFFATYDWAKTWQDLPWAHDEPTLFLAEITRRRRPGRALDIGCGAGTDSVFLAAQGWQVTALDFMPKALEYTVQRARAAGVSVTPVEADITEWQVPGAFDLVLDHGLLHNMDPVRHRAYRERVLAALAKDGDFALLHWHPRYPDQQDGKMGPRRADRVTINAFFAPELQERFFVAEEFEDLPDLVGGGMTQAYYWFRRNLSHLEPAVLLGQIRATLARHGLGAETRPAAGRTAPLEAGLPAGLLERILGPGRLGISHRVLEAGEADAALAAWSAHAGIPAADMRRLLTLFGGEQHARVCLAGAPRCEQCEVRFCKRQRYR